MKRLFSIILMTFCCALTYAKTTENAELKVHYTFASLSSAVGDHTGTLRGSASLTTMAEKPVLSLGENNGYFDMGASVGNVIATLDNFTISTDVYIPSTTALGANGNFIYTFANSTNIGSAANGCIFFGANETRYTISRTNYNAEKNVIANFRFPTSEWHTLTYRQADNKGELFLDGALVASNNISINPSQLGSTPYNFLGRPCYQGDVYLKDAYYHNFRIYNGAINDATIAELTQDIAPLNNELYGTQIDALMASITLDATLLVDDIALPIPEENGISVTWSSSNESAVSTTGQVSRPKYGSGDATVTLTITCSKGGVSKQKSFTVTVPAYEKDDKASVEADMQSISLKGHLDNLMANLHLPTKGAEGSTITWTSSQPEYLSNEGELLKQSPDGKRHVQLTAKVSKGNASQTRIYDIYIAQKEELAYYLFAYFNGNSQWQEQICFAISTDGYNYTPLNNGNPIINSADIALKQAVRDPHILRGEDGYFYMVVTDMRSSQGWSSNDGMVLLRSKDMINWTHKAIDFPTAWPHRFDRNTLTQVWAPQTIYDPEEGKYMVYYAIGESGKNYITYYSYANEDFTELTEPQILYNHGGDNTIDADIVWHDGRYHMFFKTEGQGNGIQKATAKTLRGEWVPEYKYLQQTSVAVEGSGVFKLIDSDTWVLMYDCYTSGMYEYCTSTDLSNFTKKCNSANTNIFTPRHGTTIAITAEEAQRLVKKWPSDGLALDSWFEVTDIYLENPRFENNSTRGWTFTSDASSQQTGYEAMEFWNGTFNIYQNLEVPNGKYRLSAQSYYRTTDNDWGYNNYINDSEELTAYLYANEAQVPIVSIYSEYLTDNYGNNCWGKRTDNWEYRYYPNGMMSGAYCFERGMYNNSVEVEVTNGKLTIGAINESYTNSNWCMMDNFKLEYYGKLVPVKNITLSRPVQTLIEGESVQLIATITPDNATYRKLQWTSDNEQIATVDATGKVTAHKEGTTSIYATATDDSGVSAKCVIIVRRSEPTAESLIINEIQSANIDMFVDPSFNYGAWVELYNPTSKSVSLNNLYISDDATNLTKYNLGNRGTLPAKGYYVLWFDHYNNQFPSQINFKLDFDGGTIYISNRDGEIIASQDFPMAIPRTSYARHTDGADEWGCTAEPTPGKSNATSTFHTERVEAPMVDKDACLFTSSFDIKVTKPSGTTLRYTTDGTVPTLTNGKISLTGKFTVSNTVNYRFRLFQEGKLPSQVVTRSYIYKDKDYTLPIISVVTDPINLYDDSLGVYVKGVNGRTGNGQSTPCNWNMDWDRPVNFEYITPEGEMVVNQEVDFAMCGGWSRSWTPHSFKLKAAKVYEGNNSIDYPFFADKPYLKHKTLQIRNGGNDTGCRIKDAALQEIVHRSGLDIDGQATQPVVHFINGEYKGMLNMREPNNKHFAYANWGIDTDEMDQFEMSPDSGYVQMEGTREAFLEWYDLSTNAANASTYEKIRNLVDIDEYINYMAVEFYLGGTDWPQNNIKGFRPRTDNGRFRFVMFDLDGTLATTSPFYTFEGKQNYTFDYIYDMDGHLTEEIEMVTIFLNMLNNDSFRKQFIDTYCLVTGSVFEPERCNAIIDEMAARTAPTLAYEGQSPYGTANQLKNQLANRQGTMIQALIDYWRMGLSADTRQEVKIESNVEGASLRINDMEIPTEKFSGTLFAPITLKAEPKAGYKFVGWSSNMATSTKTLIAQEAAWNYYDQGSLDGKSWTATTYSTTTWKTGKAPLGYYTSDNNNSRGYNTTINYGTDDSDKRPTYYFRTKFTLNNAPGAEDVFYLNYTVDDGMVVYVNGKEAARYLMPNGSISYSTYATSHATNNPDQGTLTLPTSLFKRGTNVIAVEVHNNSANSSDIYFSAELTQATTSNTTENIVCKEMEYRLPKGNHTLTAVYEPLTNDELTETVSLPVRINEVSADNSIYINEYYKKNDWIELFNCTDEPIDVAGMYLSDNIENFTKYQIVGDANISTIIEPYSYLIIWPDKLMNFTQLHAPFKLAAEGGYISLTAADQSWHDILYYEPHLGIESVGLYPDGSNDVYLMSTPTIAKANTINSYAAWLEQPVTPGGGQGITTETSESLMLSYHDNTLDIRSDEATSATITVYAISGKQHMRVTTELTAGYASIKLGRLSQGTYIVNVTDSNDNTETVKINI
ncbi:MAG: CotH kinase family protein [Bacteroidaceae bacterium]|nr:CotH kinase family protein [Bacteroidaceae bacterium]